MNNKSFILAMYLVAQFLVLRNYYKKGHSGIPYPTTITAPAYLYAALGIASGFLEGIPVVLSAGLTLGLYYRTHSGKDPIVIQTGPHSTRTINPHSQKNPVPVATHPGTNK